MIQLENFENIPIISQPKNLNISLYHHQLASVYQMEKREETKQVKEYNDVIVDTIIGVNADKTGYGKTMAMLAMVYRNKMEWDMSIPYTETTIKTYASGKIKKTHFIEYEKLDVTLVLVSQSIINQWYEECQKTPLSVKKITTNKLVDSTHVENYDIILVTPSMYCKIVKKYSNMACKRFIYDEPSDLKVPSMIKLVAGFIWLVTATPNSIIAKHKNCKRSFMYDLVCSAGYVPFTIHFDYMIVKNSDAFIQYSFSMPQTNHIYYKCYNPIIKTVRGLVTNNITEMLSAGNIQGAIKALGGGETGNIVNLIKQKKLEEIAELELRIKIMKIRNNKKSIDTHNDRILRIKKQIDDLDSRFNNMLDNDCPICFSPISNPVMEPSCQNIFCGNCLLQWVKSKPNCPLCRVDIQSNKLIYINTGKDKHLSKNTVAKPELKTKINTIINLIKNKPEGKFIIFSAWDQTFVPIKNHLTQNDISFIEISGSVEQRLRNINDFKTGKISCIFLNSRNNGTGINLQESSDIIILSKNILTN